jgi:hypothetical protein
MGVEMKTNERFLGALTYMNACLKEDIAEGHPWTYCNVKKKKAASFPQAHLNGIHLINCVDGVQWALQIAGVPKSALCWYGADGKIAYTTANAEKEVHKYFNVIQTGGVTVQKLYDKMLMCDGDILLGFQGFSHTCAYYGGEKSFDSGHAYCNGERFRKWIGSLSHKSSKVNFILRLKDRAQYRVQAGAYPEFSKYREQEEFLRSKGIQCSMVIEDDMYKAQVGFFNGKTNAKRITEKLGKKGITAIVKELG